MSAPAKHEWKITVPRLGNGVREADFEFGVYARNEQHARRYALRRLKATRPGLLRLPIGTKVERA